MSKKKILVFIDWYLPGFKAGGPVKSVASIVKQLSGTYDFSIITSDTDFTESLPYKDVNSNQWNVLPDNTRVFYFSKNNLSYSNIKKLIQQEEFDVIYLNSLFSIPFTIYPLLIKKFNYANKQVVLAPRGMLGKGALAIKSFKKKLFISLAKLLGLYKNILWQASSDQEANEVKQVFGEGSDVRVAANLTSAAMVDWMPKPKKINELNLVFLSRIAEKKNLLTVFEFLKQVKPNYKINFTIYGPIDELFYWEKCNALMAQMPANIHVKYEGAIAPDQIAERLRTQHVFILPTQHENFGHVILEAMAAGCPVIISDQTIWRNLSIERVGFDLSLNKLNEYVTSLNKFAEMTDVDFNDWSKNAYNYALKFLNNPVVLEQNKKVFE